MPDQSRRESQQGFTLIELLIAILVSGIVMTALSTAFITTIRGTKDLHERFVQTHDAQLLAAYFPSDVQSADPNLPISTTASAWAPCPTASDPGPSVRNVLQMQWSETSGFTDTPFTVSYRTRQVPSGSLRYELVRYFCSGATVESEVVAHNIASPAVPVVAGQKITMTLTSVPAAVISTAGNYSYTFSGEMRTRVPPPPPPRVALINRKTATPTNAASVQWSVLFDSPVTGVNGPVSGDPGDFSVVSTGLIGVGAPLVTVVGTTGTEYTVTVNTGSDSGAIRLDVVDDDSIKGTTAIPLGGTGNTNGNFRGQTYAIDRASPFVGSMTLAGSTPTSGPNVSWTVTFNEEVRGSTVGSADFIPAPSGSVSPGSITVTQVSAAIYTVTIGPVSGVGDLGLNLVDDNSINSIVDNAGNQLVSPVGGLDGSVAGPLYHIDTTAPAAPSIASVKLVNKTGGNAGEIETGDQVVIKFSAPIEVSSFCSTWSGNGSDQSLYAPSVVTVTVSDNDTLRVGAANSNCGGAFHFGTLELKADYVSGVLTFSGNGNGANTPSTVFWDHGNTELTITLGKDGAASPGAKANSGVSSSLPKYTVDGAVTDPYSQHVTPNSLTETNLRRF